MKQLFWKLVYLLSRRAWLAFAPADILAPECIRLLERTKLSPKYSESERCRFNEIEDSIRKGDFFG